MPIAGQPEIATTGQGQVNLNSATLGELSGITYAGGDQYLVVSDTNSTLAPLTINIDPATGQITASSLGTPVTLAGVADLEGIAYDPRDASVLIAAEADQSITRFNPATTANLGSVTVPAVYANARANFGLESLSLDPVGLNLWTANEEALNGDGPLSTASSGSVVRLQRFDDQGVADHQIAYLTDAYPGDNLLANIPERSGVSDLLALPSGDLLVMERALGGAIIPAFRNRIYLVDDENATDTTNTPALQGANYTPADKTQLIQVDAGFTNFEGIALGPRLDNGDYAVILVSDDGGDPGTNPQALLSLRLSGIALPGDLTGDFNVDQDDIDLVLNRWGQDVTAGRWLSGDPSGNGQVGAEDLNIVLRGWTAEQEPVVNIPEPSCLATLLSGTIALTHRRR
ncbi:MAG: esterase-like activity of phytase family protein [Planctomycetota bacterium]